ncbi:MAG TPA: flippase-like domain-containing protein [bacterium]|nr:flippase-like domain-containing protein [bacterium]
MIRKKRFWLGIAVTLVCLYFVFRGIDFGELAAILTNINPGLLALAVAVYIGGYYIRAARWRVLLKHIKPFKARELFPYLVMGFMFNNILPARAGEFIRAYITGAKKGISKSSTFATIVIERVFDGLIMIFYFILGYLAFTFVANQSQEFMSFELFGRTLGIKDAVMVFAVGGSAVFAAVFITIVFLVFKKEPTVNFLHRVVAFFPKKFGDLFSGLIDTFIEGFGVLRDKKDLITVFLLSFTAWTVEACTYYMMAMAMGIKISFLVVVLIMAVSNFAIMAPSTSGGVGPFEFFGVGVMLLFAFTKEQATAYVVAIHAMILLPIIVLGLVFMVIEGLSFKKLIKAKEEEENG